MATRMTKPAQTIQKAVSPKPAKVGAQPKKVVATKAVPPKKKVSKVPTNASGKRLTPRKRSVVKGKPLMKKTPKRVVKAK